MNAERLLKHYERIADAPDAIARLRRFILDLAVRGKLVPKDPNDEPASELLKRIAKEKARLGLKHEVSPLGSDEIPFELPKGWSWSRIGEVCSKTGSGSTPRGGQAVYKSTGIQFLRSQNVYDTGLLLDDVAYIDSSTHARMVGTAVKPKDLLLNITGGSMGRCCRVPDAFGEANVSQHVAIIRAAFPGTEDFLHRLVLSPYFQAFIFNEQTGAGRGGLPKNKMDRIAVALPPLAEQHRIVAKVDELMALCDRLEEARAEREATRDRLTAASLTGLNAPDPDTFHDDARFALDNLGALTTRPDQIKQLRQTILNLAVRGKLVAQDPSDEPASELLKRIAAEKARLLNDKSKKAKLPIPRDNKVNAFELPSGWNWFQLDELSWKITDGDHLTPKREATGRYLLSARNVLIGEINLSDVDFVGEAEFARMRSRCDPNRFDLLISCSGSVGRVAIVDKDEAYVMVRSAALVKPVFASELAPYLARAMISDCLQDQMGLRSKATAQPNLFIGAIRQLMIPLAPLAEQQRIVAKVDELMALCDRLEASLDAAGATRSRLLDALLAEALGSSSLKLEAAE
jgi:type I restriction enzyme S subunit